MGLEPTRVLPLRTGFESGASAIPPLRQVVTITTRGEDVQPAVVGSASRSIVRVSHYPVVQLDGLVCNPVTFSDGEILTPRSLVR